MGNALNVHTNLISVETSCQKLELALNANQGIICFTYGMLACFCGQHFMYSTLFWQSYRNSRWQRTKRSIGDIWSRLSGAAQVAQRELPDGLPSYQEASVAAQDTIARFQGMQEAFGSMQQGDSTAGDRLSKELQGLQANLGLAQQLGNAATATLGEIKPKRLLEQLQELRHIFFENISAALSRSAHAIGYKTSVGDCTAQSVNHFAEPPMQKLVDSLIAFSGPELVQVREDQNVGKWIQGAIKAVCCSLGIAASFYIESLVLPFVNARLGAELISEGLCRMMTQRGLCRQPPKLILLGVEWLLCAGGLYFQLVLGTSGGIKDIMWRFFFSTPKLPAFARMVLSMPLIAESWLRSAVAAHRLGIVGPKQVIADAVPVVSDGPVPDWIVVNSSDSLVEVVGRESENSL